MQIFYFDGTKTKDFRAKNFGDELNLWLWPQILPEVLKQYKETLFVGIGTLLNKRLPHKAHKVIFGAGVGYGDLPNIDDAWKIYFVRGKLSAKALGIDPEIGITDPAILLRRFFDQSSNKKYRRSYMPHYVEAIINDSGLKEICNSLGVHYIDPTESIQTVLTEISETEVLFTEVMHGAIVADALRVPWVPIKTHKRVLEFKWLDWMSSIEAKYKPFVIRRAATIIGKDSLPRYSDYQFIRAQMLYVLQTAKPILSISSKSNELEDKIMLKIKDLEDDVFNKRL